MNKFVSFATSATALFLVSFPLSAVDLRAADPLPPTPPGSSLPPASSTTPSSTPTSTPQKGKGKHGGEHRFKKLKEELSLTPQQVAQIKPIVEKAVADVKALRANTSLPEAQKKKSVHQIFAASFKQIKPLLTPQQLQKWKQIRAEHHNKQSTPSAANTNT